MTGHLAQGVAAHARAALEDTNLTGVPQMRAAAAPSGAENRPPDRGFDMGQASPDWTPWNRLQTSQRFGNAITSLALDPVGLEAVERSEHCT